MASLNDNALTTLDVIESEISDYTKGADSADDNRFIRYINAVSSMVEEICGALHYAADHVERVAGYGRSRLIVDDHRPVKSIDSIEFDDGRTTDTIDAGDYQIEDDEAGFIEHLNGAWVDTSHYEQNYQIAKLPGTRKPSYKVTYTGGWITRKQDDDGVGSADIPAWIEDAVVDAVVLRESRRGADPSVTRIAMDDGAITYAKGPSGQRVQVPTSLNAVLDRFRRITIA